MTVTGIIAEFNPFHNGHQRLLEAAGENIKVVAMSGNWMQRGEPAFIDKWTRTEMALANGADLVVELPFLVAVQGADFFASGGVNILRRLGIEELLFGSEDDTTDYQQISDLYAQRSTEMQAYMDALPNLMSYPAKAQAAWQRFANVQFDGNTPNHILGLAYAKAAAGTGIKLRTIQRNTAYNSIETTETFASASAIRKGIEQSEVRAFVPENCWALLHQKPYGDWTDFWELLRYKILSTTDLSQIYQVNEELGHRMQQAVKHSKNSEELIERVYTKRYTKGHIRRLLTYILLNIPKTAVLPEQIHVLGFSALGQALLAQARGQICTRIGKFPWDETTQRADAIYQIAGFSEQTYGRKPIIWR